MEKAPRRRIANREEERCGHARLGHQNEKRRRIEARKCGVKRVEKSKGGGVGQRTRVKKRQGQENAMNETAHLGAKKSSENTQVVDSKKKKGQ